MVGPILLSEFNTFSNLLSNSLVNRPNQYLQITLLSYFVIFFNRPGMNSKEGKEASLCLNNLGMFPFSVCGWIGVGQGIG